jgi:hypothetical protein
LFVTSAVTNMSYMFLGCSSLQTVPLFVTSAVTNMSNMFYNCYSLQTVPLFVTSAVTNMSNMFCGCGSLQSIPALSCGAVTTWTSFVASCPALAAAPLSGPAETFSMASCRMARDELVALFNGLGTVVGKTLTITGNWGVPYLSDPDKAIATDKGWTLVL